MSPLATPWVMAGSVVSLAAGVAVQVGVIGGVGVDLSTGVAVGGSVGVGVGVDVGAGVLVDLGINVGVGVGASVAAGIGVDSAWVQAARSHRLMTSMKGQRWTLLMEAIITTEPTRSITNGLRNQPRLTQILWAATRATTNWRLRPLPKLNAVVK